VEIEDADSDIRSQEINGQESMDQIQDWSKGTPKIVKEVAERVVVIQNEDGSTASGIAWREEHVATDEAAGDSAKLITSDGTVLVAELAGQDPSTNIALFKADVDQHPFQASGEVQPGDFAVAIGRGLTSELVAAGFNNKREDTLLDTFCYGIAISLGNNEGY
jgi:S1-C subfamily serine protease